MLDHRILVLAILVPALVLPVHRVAAQGRASVKPGWPVRLGLSCESGPCQTAQGTLLWSTPDTLTIKTRGDAVLALSRNDIAWVEVRNGRSGARKGAIIGGGVGLGTGVLFGAGLCATFGGGEEGGCFATFLGVAIFNGAVFAGLGALIGAVASPAKWTTVPPSTVQVALRSLPDSRVGIGLSFPLGGPRARGRTW
jgi:hypothetical protein